MAKLWTFGLAESSLKPEVSMKRLFVYIHVCKDTNESRVYDRWKC